MTNDNDSLLSLDVGYCIIFLIVVFNYIDSKSIIDLLFFSIITVYYIKIKIYRWKRYH